MIQTTGKEKDPTRGARRKREVLEEEETTTGEMTGEMTEETTGGRTGGTTGRRGGTMRIVRRGERGSRREGTGTVRTRTDEPMNG